MTISVDGIACSFDILDQTKAIVPHRLPPCSMPCVDYDGSLNMVLVPSHSHRIHHFRWPCLPTAPVASSPAHPHPTQSISTPNPTSPPPRRISASLISSSVTSLLSRHRLKQANKSNRPNKPNKEKEVKRESLSLRNRRHSSYNDYGYACQTRTAQYIQQNPYETTALPNFECAPVLIHSIQTHSLNKTASEVINVATCNDRVATVNRYGDIALYALNGTTAAKVALNTKTCWMDTETDHMRRGDRLSDGYDLMINK
ncbi:hypothetical protein BDF14DRAFT_1131698 [Spinellus fusiger]|nr:hypothetical protein BDF14DRAFT_1131698 [Spinellus fusiger]